MNPPPTVELLSISGQTKSHLLSRFCHGTLQTKYMFPETLDDDEIEDESFAELDFTQSKKVKKPNNIRQWLVDITDIGNNFIWLIPGGVPTAYTALYTTFAILQDQKPVRYFSRVNRGDSIEANDMCLNKYAGGPNPNNVRFFEAFEYGSIELLKMWEKIADNVYKVVCELETDYDDYLVDYVKDKFIKPFIEHNNGEPHETFDIPSSLECMLPCVETLHGMTTEQQNEVYTTTLFHMVKSLLYQMILFLNRRFAPLYRLQMRLKTHNETLEVKIKYENGESRGFPIRVEIFPYYVADTRYLIRKQNIKATVEKKIYLIAFRTRNPEYYHIELVYNQLGNPNQYDGCIDDQMVFTKELLELWRSTRKPGTIGTSLDGNANHQLIALDESKAIIRTDNKRDGITLFVSHLFKNKTRRNG